jgi:hypothetical protein
MGYTIKLLRLYLIPCLNKLECYYQIFARLEPILLVPLIELHSKDRLGPYSQHFIFLQLTNGPKRLEYYITLGRKGLPRTNTLAYWAHFIIYREDEVCEYDSLLANVRLGWRWLAVTNAPGYNIAASITAVKKFYSACPWGQMLIRGVGSKRPWPVLQNRFTLVI